AYTQAKAFELDGTKTQERVLDAIDETVVVYKDGKPAYEQVWRAKNASDPKSRDYLLVSLKVPQGADGKDTLKILFQPDGATPYIVEFYPESEILATEIRIYRTDGTLKRTITRNGAERTEKDYTVEDNVREKLDESMLSMPAFDGELVRPTFSPMDYYP